MTAFDKLTSDLACLRDGRRSEVNPDEIGEGLEQVADFVLIGTRRTSTIRLDVYLDAETSTHAGVRYLHHDEMGSGEPTIVQVKRVVRETWDVL